MEDKHKKNKLPKKRTRRIIAFIVLAFLCVFIFCAYNFFIRKNNRTGVEDSLGKQQILNQNEKEEKKLKMSEYDCRENSREGYVKIAGNIVRPGWLDSQKKLFVIVDREVYLVGQDDNFCVFASPKVDVINVVLDNEWEKPVLLFALVANKDKKITIDVQSTAVALVFKGTQSDWQQNSLEDSITAFNHIQQNENIKKLAEAISRDSNFVAKNITNDDSEVAEAYQQSISSLESGRYQISESKADTTLIVILNPIDFYQDSDESYSINGNIVAVENISPGLASVEFVLKDVKEGNQLGIFFDTNKFPSPKKELNVGYNDRKVRIKAVFEGTTGQFVAEEFSIL